MKSYRLTRLRSLLLALLAVFAFGVVAAAAAQAEETAPYWTVPKSEGSSETKRLREGETRFITAKTYNATTLTGLGVTVTCPTVELKEGVLLGSETREPGKDDAIVEFKGGCTQTGNGTSCTVVEPITTVPVKSELVENVEGAAAGKKLLTEFFPATGARFATVKFTGTCTVTSEIAVEGKVAAEVRTDPNAPPGIGEAVELPNRGKTATSWLLNFPGTPIKEVWLVTAGTGKAAKVGLAVGSEPLTFAGAVLVLLANSKRETREETWSPLP
ncbi:MAG TPA: hypothetical protein VG147_05125 [Solirubrobacteraceae bacterium]|jgi:hypothetical protein|nr:hypothetical protein [Solirubrobacteraceae bacterium]